MKKQVHKSFHYYPAKKIPPAKIATKFTDQFYKSSATFGSLWSNIVWSIFLFLFCRKNMWNKKTNEKKRDSFIEPQLFLAAQ